MQEFVETRSGANDSVKNLAIHEVVVIDGGFASQLSRHVSARVDGDPLWSARYLADDPKAVVDTHLDFLRAGAQVLTTNTYQASVGGFMEHLGVSGEEALELITNAVSYAKEAINLYESEKNSDKATMSKEEGVATSGCQQKIRVAGSVGPYGASLHDGSEYNGDYVKKVSAEEIAEWHRPRIAALVRSGVDLLAFETIPAVEEARVLVQMLVTEFPGQKAWLSFSSQDGENTSNGTDFVAAVRECWAMGQGQLVAIGVNCTKSSLATALLSKVANSDGPAVPLIVYPNSGENWDPEKGWQDQKLCEPITSHISKWIDVGVCYMGGCCRVYSEEVAAIRKEVEALVLRKTKDW